MRMTLLALVLLAACVIVQSVGILLLIHWLARRRRDIESASIGRRLGILVQFFVCIVALHLVQVGLWAFAFWRAGKVPTLETAVYFSLVTYSAIGFGDVVLEPGWRVLGGIEGLAGVVLLGWSTAFIFAVMSRMYEYGRQRYDVR